MECNLKELSDAMRLVHLDILLKEGIKDYILI